MASTIRYTLADSNVARILWTRAGARANVAATVGTAAHRAIAGRDADTRASRAKLSSRAISVASATTTVWVAAGLVSAVGLAGLAVSEDAKLGVCAVASLTGVDAVAIHANRSWVANNVGAWVHIAGSLNTDFGAVADAVAWGRREAPNRAGVVAFARTFAGNERNACAEAAELSLSTIRTEARRRGKTASDGLALDAGLFIGTVRAFARIRERHALLPTDLPWFTRAIRGHTTIRCALTVKTDCPVGARVATRVVTSGSFTASVDITSGTCATRVHRSISTVLSPPSLAPQAAMTRNKLKKRAAIVGRREARIVPPGLRGTSNVER
ncbi:MAG: hypothetical protein GY811_13795 [Myxococcales bacterium]|nr:hypothetical protein [Myxococcales bacterium]